MPIGRAEWTFKENDEGAATTVTFEEYAGKILVTLHEPYPTKTALDEALADSAQALPEQFARLDELLEGKS